MRFKTKTIGEVAEVQTGPFGSQLHKEDYVEAGTPIVTVEHLGQRRFSTQNLPRVKDCDRDRLSKYTLKTGDLVFSRVGSVDRISFVTEDENGWMFSGRCLRLRVFGEIDALWLYYFFCLEQTKQFVRNIAVGATMPSINTKLLSEVPVSYPENIADQRKIASILSLIDDKIELNSTINHNLQQQAQALYRQMFCSTPHPDWRNGVLSDIADIVMGQSPDGKSYNEDGIGTVFYQGRAEFGTRFPTQRLFTAEPKRMAQENDVLISVRAPVGDLNVAKEDCCIGRGLGAVRSNDGHQSFVLYTMFALRSQLNVFNGEGTVFGSINRDSFNSLPVIIPPTTEINKFEALVAPMDKAIRTNHDEICHLQSLRDALLPRLMSGEIDVSEVEI